MPEFHGLRDAARLTGKSISTFRRLVRSIVADEQHPDRHFLLPTVEEVSRLKTAGEQFAWTISEELLDREFGKDTGRDATARMSGRDAEPLAELIALLREQLHAHGIEIVRFHRENDLTFSVGEAQVQPDGFFRFAYAGRFFNVAVELDQSTESVVSFYDQSIRQKLALYDAYQASVLNEWLANDRSYERPRFRVAFFTRSVVRAYHILSLASELTLHSARRLVYAITQESFTHESDPLRQPIFLDHQGRWQALVDPHPTAPFQREPVRLTRPAGTSPTLDDSPIRVLSDISAFNRPYSRSMPSRTAPTAVAR